MTPKTQSFLKQKPLAHYYAGSPHLSADKRTFEVFNPSDGAVLAIVSDGSEADLEKAVSAAHSAFPAWAATPVRERAVLLHRLADLIARDLERRSHLRVLLKLPEKLFKLVG